MRTPPARSRRGSVLPLVCLSSLALLGFVALAVDLGVVAVARTECQNVADSAAMAGARTLNGDKAGNNNLSAAGPAALNAARYNEVLGKSVPTNQVTTQFGSYSYDDSAQKFIARVPKLGTENWSLCKATVTATGDTYFAKVFGVSSIATTTTATAVHRPRDVALVLDFSGSMRFGSLPGVGHSGARAVSGGSPTSGSNNPESTFPRFGHYSNTSAAGLQRSSPVNMNGNSYDLANFTEASSSTDYRAPLVGDFYQHSAGTSPSGAFQSAGDGDSQGWVAGDKFQRRSSASYSLSGPFTYTAGSSYAETVQQLLNIGTVSASTRDWRWELDGYAAGMAGSVDGTANYQSSGSGGHTNYTAAPFTGYTRGPRYWGKTFFMWPPDPRAPLADATAVTNFLTAMGLSSTQASAIASGFPYSSDSALTTKLTSATVNIQPSNPNHQRIFRLLRNRPNADWRKKFFLKSDGTTPLDDNSLLWDSDGDWKSPTSGGTANYRINYQAILKWMFTEGPNPFPPQLRAGRIKYYTGLPSTSDNGLNSRWWNSYPVSDPNERFWKEYIDYVVGVRATGTSSWDEPSSANPNIIRYTGYGDNFTWGTTKVTANSTLTGTPKPYMHYQDNPKRPRLHLWFGPMTMVDFLGNYNMGGRASNQSYWWWPGTAHEAPLYASKIGIRGALQDIEKNHPNDHVSLIMFNVPRTSATDTTNARRFNRVRAPLGRDYARMIDALWFPAHTLDNPGSEINMYDFEKNIEVPRAMGGTCYSMGLMLAYNQFSSRLDLRTYNPSPAPSGDAGGLGRRGAQKVVIFQTDGLPNHTATAALTNGGACNSYYKIRHNSSGASGGEYPSVSSTGDNDPSVTGQIFDICRQIVALDTSSPPGYSTTRRPALIHCIGFGPAVEPSGAERASALATLSQMETIGGIPAEKRIGTAPYKTVYGSDSEMIETLKTAISTIMQDGVQVTLIE